MISTAEFAKTQKKKLLSKALPQFNAAKEESRKGDSARSRKL
jgi:hypothetical protein